jgi:hypothetical protein
MGVTGPGSYGSTFSWFVDRTSAALPRPTLYSVPRNPTIGGAAV